MARQTFDINFYCRNSKVDKNGFAPIELSIIINGERNYLRLQRKERPDDFKKALESKRANDLKGFIEGWRIRINDIVEQMSFAEVELTAENLKECLKKGGVPNFYAMGQLWKDILRIKTDELNNGDLDSSTVRKYQLAKDALYEANNINDKTPAKEVTVQHIFNLQNYLRKKGLKQNTIYQYHAKCLTAFTLAFESGKIRSNPYASFKMEKGEKKEIVWLDQSELQRIKEKKLHTGRLENVRDIFVFQCNSGLAYGDLALLEKKDFIQNELEQYVIQKRRIKNGREFTSFVLKDGVQILEKYNFQLPVLSNQKYNAYLKEIQELCEIEKKMTTHLARRTYICLLYNQHVDIETISALVGHDRCTTTLKYYAKMDIKTISEELRRKGVANTRQDKPKGKKAKTEKDDGIPDKVVSIKNESILEVIKTKGIKID